MVPSNRFSPSHLVLFAALLATSGCAVDKAPPETPRAPRRPSLVSFDDQLHRAQRAYAKLGDARQNLIATLERRGVAVTMRHDLQLPPSKEPVVGCPPGVRDYALGAAKGLSTHRERLAEGLIMLEDELSEQGNESPGCYVVDDLP